MDYKQLKECFKKTIESSLELLKLCEWDKSNSRQCFMQPMLHKHILAAKTILNLLPEEEKFFDFNSIVNLTRNIIHSFKPYYYLIIDDITNEEYELRRLLYQCYGLAEDMNMAKLLGEDTTNLESQYTEIKQEIEKNVFFKNLRTNKSSEYGELYHKITKNQIFSNGFRDMLLKNKGCYIQENKVHLSFFEKFPYVQEILKNNSENIQQSNKIIENQYKYFYKYLSNYVHSSAFALYQLSSSRFGFNKNDYFLELIISCNIFYLSLSIEKMLEECNFKSQNHEQINNFKENFSGMEPYVYFMLIPVRKLKRAEP